MIMWHWDPLDSCQVTAVFSLIGELCGLHKDASQLVPFKLLNWSSCKHDYFSLLSQQEEAASARSSVLFRYSEKLVMRSWKTHRKHTELSELSFWRSLHMIWGEGKYLSSCPPWKEWEIQSTYKKILYKEISPFLNFLPV